MALTFRGSANSNDTGASTEHTFGPFSIGSADSDRRVIIAYFVSGMIDAPTITVGGITASHVHSIIRPTNREGFYIVTVPTGATAAVVVTHADSVGAGVGVWTATGMTTSSPMGFFGFSMTTAGSVTRTFTTVDDGMVLVVQFRHNTGLDAGKFQGWTGVDGDFADAFGGFLFAAGSAAPTEAGSLTVTNFNPVININSGWAGVSWASGGAGSEGGGGGGGGGEIPGDGGTPTPSAGDRITDLNAVFFRLATDPPLRLWCGINDIPIELVNVDAAGAVYLGAGRLLNVPDLEVLINGIADRVEFYLPGVSVENANRVAAAAPEIQGLPVHVGVATLDDRYQPVTNIIPVWYGLADLWAMKQPLSSDRDQPPSRTLVLSVGSGRTGRARARRASYTPAQQKLVYPTDKFCDFTPRYTTLYEVVWPKFLWGLWLLWGVATAIPHLLANGIG